MSNTLTAQPSTEFDSEPLPYGDAWSVAHDPVVKDGSDVAAANRRVIARIEQGIQQGESAMPGIEKRERLARVALGAVPEGHRTLLDKVGDATRKITAKIKLSGQNYNMLFEENKAASHAPMLDEQGSYPNIDIDDELLDPAFDFHRISMTPEEIRVAEIAKVRGARKNANEAELAVEARMNELQGPKSGPRAN